MRYQPIDETGPLHLRCVAAPWNANVPAIRQQLRRLGGKVRIDNAIFTAANQQRRLRDLGQPVAVDMFHRLTISLQETGTPKPIAESLLEKAQHLLIHVALIVEDAGDQTARVAATQAFDDREFFLFTESRRTQKHQSVDFMGISDRVL